MHVQMRSIDEGPDHCFWAMTHFYTGMFAGEKLMWPFPCIINLNTAVKWKWMHESQGKEIKSQTEISSDSMRKQNVKAKLITNKNIMII